MFSRKLMNEHRKRLKPGRSRYPGRTANAFLLVAALTLAACSETPTETDSVGAVLVPNTLSIRDTSLSAGSWATFKQTVPMDSATDAFGYKVNITDLVGRTGHATANAAINFTSLPNRDTIQVLSATLTLRLVSWFGDSAGTFACTAHKILTGWTASGLTWDSVQTGFYESGIIRGSYGGRVEADTQVISLQLDTAIVREWLQPSTITSNGILLVPSQTTSVVRGINAFGYDSTQFWPTLTVICRNTAGTVLDTTQYTSGIDTFVGTVDDIATNTALMYLQSGVAYRSTLQFDVSGIPRGALINTAELRLVRDPSASRISKFSGSPQFSVHVLLSGSDYTMFENDPVVASQVEATDTFAVDIRHAVQIWLKGSNSGLLLRATDLSEFNSFDRYALHGPSAQNEAVRPRLKIVYSLQKF